MVIDSRSISTNEELFRTLGVYMACKKKSAKLDKEELSKKESSV
jgi:hypothetical protein